MTGVTGGCRFWGVWAVWVVCHSSWFVVHSWQFPLTLNLFWRVSADTKTCGSPRNPSPTGVPSKAGSATSSLPSGKHAGILTYLQIIVNKKNDQKIIFFVHPPNH